MADSELDPHLAERLGEVVDTADFRRREARVGSDEVERAMALPEHLGGRAISDRFSRAKPTPKPGLEPHLKSRLAEVQDSPLVRQSADDAVEQYRALRRRMGGS
ncbi:MAG TPA: hypothetical protein V6D47_11230 [Oscillatoriaceae cyanobacterium]